MASIIDGVPVAKRQGYMLRTHNPRLFNPVLVELLSQRVSMQSKPSCGSRTLAEFVADDCTKQRRFDKVEKLLVKVFAIIVLTKL